MRRPLAAAVALSLASIATAARANMAAVQRNPAVVGAVATTGPNPLRVDHEKLSFTCTEVREAPVCAFEARYAVSNPDAVRHEIAAAFLGFRARDVVITVDGVRAGGTPSAAEMKAILASAHAAEAGEKGEKQPREGREGLAQWGFTLVSGPKAKHEIVVRGKVVPGQRFIPDGYALRAVTARHLLASSRTPERTVFDLEYLVAPIRTWKGDPRIDVEVTHPSKWRVSVQGGDAQWDRASRGGTGVITRTLTSSSAPPVLGIEIEPPPRVFMNGGPLIGIGGTFGSHRGVRGRIGYEVAAPSWLLFSATADTNFRDRFILTPLVEAASYSILFLPSIGIGVGAPVQISPDPRVGVRLQGDMHFWSLGLVTSVDIYPRFGTLAGFTEASLLGQVGF